MDLILLSEIKTDDAFLDSQSFAEGYKIYRKDRTKTKGGLSFYVNGNLPGTIISSYEFKENSEIILFEFSTTNKRWLLLDNYKPLSQNHLSFTNKLNLAFSFFSPIHKSFVLLGNFNDLNVPSESPNLKSLAS